MLERKINLNINSISCICLLYIYAACIIFTATWLRWYLAVPAVVCQLVILFGVVRKFKASLQSDKKIAINIWFLILFFAGALFLGYICGWSGYVHQVGDWPKHNAIMRDMLERKWPVIYEANGEKAMLTYYIGQYVVPTFISKFIDFQFYGMNQLNWLWASFGLFLVWLLFMIITGATTVKKQTVCLAILIFAGGLMALQQSLGHVLYPNRVSIGLGEGMDYYFSLVPMLQFRTNFINMRWVYGQTIVSWMIVMLLYAHRDKIDIFVPIAMPGIMYSSFSFLTIVWIAIFIFLKWIWEAKGNISHVLKITFSWQNLLAVVSPGLILITYYLGYMMQPKPGTQGIQFVGYSFKATGLYILFTMGSFGLYALLVAKEYYKDSAFLGAVSVMFILPFFTMGGPNDLLMGGCIAPSMLLYVYLARWLFKADRTMEFRKGILITLVLIGFIKPALEIYSIFRYHDLTKRELADEFVTLENYVNRSDENLRQDVVYNYFTYDCDDSIFMKYLGKKR